MYWLLIFIALTVLTIIYYTGYFCLALLLRVNHSHYFLGFGNRLFDVKVRGVLFSVGIFIPIYGLARIYKVEGQVKERPDFGWQFFEKPLLMRLLVTYGGVLSLLITGIFSFIMYTYIHRETFISKSEVDRYGIYPSPLAEQYGFQKGDRILNLNGKDYDRFNELLDTDNLTEGSTFAIVRDGKEFSLTIKDFDFEEQGNIPFLDVWVPFEIDSITPGSPAEEIGLVKGDRIVSVNGDKIVKIREMQKAFDEDVDGKVTIEIQRHANKDTLLVKEAHLNEQNRLGVFTHELLMFTDHKYSLLESVGIGTKRAFFSIIYEIRAFIGLASPKRMKGGPVRISQAFGNRIPLEIYWYYIGSWAMWFVLWNFLPFPKAALWETVALVYEGLSGRKYFVSFFRTTLTIGWIIFIALTLWTLLNDLMLLL